MRLRASQRPLHERFAVPHTFKPQLTFLEAIISAGGALLRILLGSLLFAFYGWYSFVSWSAFDEMLWRVVVLIVLTAGFIGLFTLLMLSIASLVRKALDKVR
jgi:hypothetical protein